MAITTADVNRVEREQPLRDVFAALAECDAFIAQGKAALQSSRDSAATRLGSKQFNDLVTAAKVGMDPDAAVALDAKIASALERATKA